MGNREMKMEKELPNAKDSEAVALGVCMVNETHFSYLVENLEASDFRNPFHADVFRIMFNFWDRNDPVPFDAVLIGEELRKQGKYELYGGQNAVNALMIGIPDLAEERLGNYVKLIKGKSKARDVINIANRISSAAMDEAEDIEAIIDDAQVEFLNLNSERDTRSFSHVQEIADKVMAQAADVAENHTGVTGITTGYKDLDRMTSGLQKKDLIIVAARPSMGKTAICLNIAANAAIREGANIAVFSLEMSKEALVNRMLCSEAMVDSMKFRNGLLDRNDWARLSVALGDISSANIFIDDSPAISPAEMRAKTKRLLAQQKQLDMILVDYMQLMSSDRASNSRQQEISEISRALKGLAKEFDVPLVALSQLSRAPEGRADKRPMMSDLRESGAIEQDADVVAFIYRDEYYNPNPDNKGLAEIIISKQRNGPTGTVNLAFIENHTKFVNIHY